MKHFAIAACGVVLAATVATSGLAQTMSPLAYVQPVPPSAVEAVQDHLRSAGVYSGAVDGVWGPDSAAALQRFQAGHQLQVTGQLNQATAATLGLDPAALLAMQAPIPMPPPETLQPASVRTVQAQMRRLGFYPGTVDGVWGASTESAVERFQQARGLPPNGQLTTATLTAMGLVPGSLAYR